MDDLNRANETREKLTDVRIVYLPPATVAASHFIGPSPEKNAALPLDRFVRESPRYEENWGERDCMGGLLEELLNCIHHVDQPDTEPEGEVQLDLLFPIVPRQQP